MFPLVCAVFILICSTLAIFGNVLTVVIFSRPHMKSAMSVLLAGLALTDLTLSVLTIPVFTIQPLNVYLRSTLLLQFTIYLPVTLYPLAMMAQSASIWLLLLITFERYLAICKPFLSQRLWTRRHTRRVVVVIFVVAILYNFIRYWEFQLREMTVTVNGSNFSFAVSQPYLRADRYYFNGYYTALYLVSHFAAPFCLIAILNIYIVRAIRTSEASLARLSVRDKKNHRTAKMMILIVLVFGLCNFLAFTLNIWEALDNDLFRSEATKHRAYITMDINNMLIVINSGSNPVIYYLMNESYRRTMQHLLCGRCFKGWQLSEAEKQTASMRYRARKSFSTSTVLYRRNTDTILDNETGSMRWLFSRNPSIVSFKGQCRQFISVCSSPLISLSGRGSQYQTRTSIVRLASYNENQMQQNNNRSPLTLTPSPAKQSLISSDNHCDHTSPSSISRHDPQSQLNAVSPVFQLSGAARATDPWFTTESPKNNYSSRKMGNPSGAYFHSEAGGPDDFMEVDPEPVDIMDDSATTPESDGSYPNTDGTRVVVQRESAGDHSPRYADSLDSPELAKIISETIQSCTTPTTRNGRKWPTERKSENGVKNSEKKKLSCAGGSSHRRVGVQLSETTNI